MTERDVVISGAGGLIGTDLSRFLSDRGYAVRRLVRRVPTGPDEIEWDPEAGTIDASRLERSFAVVHLAGEPVSGRWTAAKKAAILNSRVSGTRTLAQAIAQLTSPPRVWVSASAVGYYGDRAAELLTEQSPPGADYLSEVCQAWERETAPARELTRVVQSRIGLVLAKDGGVLERMLTPFKFGVGGKLGSGEQYMSWITLRDAVRAFEHCLRCDSISGPVNFVGPKPVPNSQLTEVLGRVLKRPTMFAVPELALRAAFGEFAAAILASQRVHPAALVESGFSFEDPELEAAFRTLLAGA